MTAASGPNAAIIDDNHLMSAQALSPLWRILRAPFTRRAWTELAYAIVSVPLAVGALAFIVPMLANGAVFSQYVETRYAADLLSMRSGGVGYLLKDRVANVGEFTDAIARVAAGGTALDPEVVTGLLNASRHASALSALTARERDVLALMAEGRSNSAIADQLVISDRAVEKHISNIFSKLGLPPSDSDHRRVLAVLAYLGS